MVRWTYLAVYSLNNAIAGHLSYSFVTLGRNSRHLNLSFAY